MEINIDYKKTGVISEIERYAINDGPGIRTVIFLKGCPLRCMWCANPETHTAHKQLMYWQARCIGCRQCIGVCTQNALSWGSHGIRVDRSLCDVCGDCAKACNSEALTVAGDEMSVAEVFDIIKRDELFYKNSGGGVTFSGGEAMQQTDFVLALANVSKSAGIHTCMETSGCAPQKSFERVTPYIDLFLFDLKLLDDEMHKKHTGVPNRLILSNFTALVASGANVNVRIPVIPGINDTEANIHDTIGFLKEHGYGSIVSLLPYHRLGTSKYTKLDMEYELGKIKPPAENQMQKIAAQFRENGFQVTIGE